MGLFYFLIGVIVGALLLVILPLFVAVLGATLAIGIFVALPLVVAGLILIGISPVACAGLRSAARRDPGRIVVERPYAAVAALDPFNP